METANRRTGLREQAWRPRGDASESGASLPLSDGVRRAAFLPALLCAAAIAPAAAANVAGAVVEFRSPNDVVERCVALEPMPGGVYSDMDVAQEATFCAIDFYAGGHGLCPKLFSTSPATLVYDISRGEFAGRAAAFESAQCGRSGHAKRGALGEPIAYKMTMNDRQTSATFSTASLLYYHFSRYLDAAIHVPVSVYRSIDVQAHHARVIRRGVELSNGGRSSAMNRAGWRIMDQAARNPAAYPATDELFTADRQAMYGVLLHPEGDRYGPELNGTRRSGWGAGQNRDFQETAAFRALRTGKPLEESIANGVRGAAADPVLHDAMPAGAEAEQMVYWMQELTEITLLDFIFSQQDRIGNIDYVSYWYWHEDGAVARRPASSSRVPADLAERHPLRLKRTHLNDNDAGGRVPYANFTKTTSMLERIRHYSARTYRRLQQLAADFDARGELYRYVRDTFGLSPRQFAQILTNTRLAASILADSCKAGRLRFDLDPERFLATGEAEPLTVDCEHP
ncbi:MAG: hypothetical protein ACU85V_12495 [Gammaproteobacteria bacterium]